MSHQSWREVIKIAPVDGAAITAAAATSLLPTQSKFAFQPGFFDTIGQQLCIKAWGRISTVVTSPGTARFDVRLGGTVVFDSLAIALDGANAYTNQSWELEILLTLRTAGNAANFFGQGKWTSPNVSGVAAAVPHGAITAMLPWNSAPAVGGNFDATIQEAFDLFFTQTLTTGSVTLHQLSVSMDN